MREAYPNELYHHGILGQKWGKKNGPPYPLDAADHSSAEKKAGWKKSLNKDGSLTEKGERKYSKMSDRKLYKTLKKQIQKQRSEQHGSANKWRRNLGIGDASNARIEQYKKDRAAYEATPEYKSWVKKMDKLDREGESLDLSNPEAVRDYDRRYSELYDQKPKENYNTILYAKVNRGKGWEYLDNFLNKGGKEMSLAYLKDLGYNGDVAKQFIKRLNKAGFTLADS